MNINYEFRSEMFDIMYVWINLMLKNLKQSQQDALKAIAETAASVN